jgi:hypothetical protein
MHMSTIAEIEAAIERLSASQMEEIARWLDTIRARRTIPRAVDSWLDTARGAAKAGVTTAAVLAATRGEE